MVGAKVAYSPLSNSRILLKLFTDLFSNCLFRKKDMFDPRIFNVKETPDVFFENNSSFSEGFT